MAWPGHEVGDNEHIGRRLFDEPLLTGAEDQEPFQGLRVDHFLEKRDRETSLDRLGRSSIERKVVNILRKLAEEAGKKLAEPQGFNGWAYVRARDLRLAKNWPLPVIE